MLKEHEDMKEFLKESSSKLPTSETFEKFADLMDDIAARICAYTVEYQDKIRFNQRYFMEYLVSDDAGSPVVNGVWEEMNHFMLMTFLTNLIHSLGQALGGGKAAAGTCDSVIEAVHQSLKSFAENEKGPSAARARDTYAVLVYESKWRDIAVERMEEEVEKHASGG